MLFNSVEFVEIQKPVNEAFENIQQPEIKKSDFRDPLLILLKLRSAMKINFREIPLRQIDHKIIIG
jgi:hypothetical protein